MSQDQEFQTISIETTTNESLEEQQDVSPETETCPNVKNLSVLDADGTEKPVKRKADGTIDRRIFNKGNNLAPQWKKGHSGNPKGRPKGGKNRLTLLREAVKHNAETLVLEEFEKVVKATLDLAKEGDSTALKIVWDRIMPSKRAIEEKTDGKDDKLNISITIEGMEVKSVGGEPLDGEFTEIEDND